MRKKWLGVVGAGLLLLGWGCGCSASKEANRTVPVAMEVGSYIRPQFYAAGKVDVEQVRACQDLILFAAEPKADGELYFKFEVWESVLQALKEELRGKRNGAWVEDRNGASVETRGDASVEGLNGRTRLRLGVHHGDWRSACRAEHRDRLVESVCRVVDQGGFDGVDLDFEWPSTPQEYADYSATIVALKARLGEGRSLSVSLHPTAYRISDEAVQAVDWVSLQCYGPRPVRFSFEVFQRDVQAALDYGIPASKLVAGLPFYATAGRGAEGTVAYWQLVEAGVVKEDSLDEAFWKGEVYTFNGRTTLQRKVQWVRGLGLRGVMSWDLATDCAYRHPQSLNRMVVEEARPSLAVEMGPSRVLE